MTGTRIVLLLLVITLTAGYDSDLVFENDGPRRIDDVENIPSEEEDLGIGGRIQKFPSQLLGILVDLNNIFSSTSEPTPTAQGEKNLEDDFREGENDIISVHHSRFRRAVGDDEDDDGPSGYSHSGDEIIQITPGKELTMRVTFVVSEPYQEEFSNRDSIPFQNLSRNLADGVHEILDRLQGEYRARLVRIQSRPDDTFTCKVTLELQSIYFYDSAKIEEVLRRHIRDNRRLGTVAVSDEDWRFKKFDEIVETRKDCAADEIQCGSGECIIPSKRCDGFTDCEDGSDERECSLPGNPVEEETDNLPLPNIPETSTLPVVLDTTPYATSPTESSTYVIDEYTTLPPSNQPRCRADDQVRCTDSSDYIICEAQWCDGNRDCPNGEDEKECPTHTECATGEFACDVSRCLDSSKVCDGETDCIDGADELDCQRCRPNDFVCDDNKCIERFRKCDRVIDCRNGEDERNCPCLVDEIRCGDGSCIESRKKCDGVPNCSDGSDEEGCSSCAPDSYRCRSGHCISQKEVCDGVPQCPDEDDEEKCSEPECDLQCNDGTCLDNSKRCNNVRDCRDGEDERDCGLCDEATEFRCNNGECINEEKRCDEIADCADQSDEIDCPPKKGCRQYEFHCHSGECIQEEFRCDNYPDCSDSSDEINCPVEFPPSCPSDSILCDDRCVGPEKICDGRNDCRDGKDEQNCVKTNQCASFEYQCADNSCVNYRLVCNGINDCRDGSDELECEAKGCPSTDWQCLSGECVNARYLCDGRADCRDGSDENHPSCIATTQAPITTQAPFTRPPYTPPPVTQRPPWTQPGSQVEGLDLKTYPNDQIIKQSGEVVFQCRDEGPIRVAVRWVREGGRPLPAGSTDRNGRLEMPNIQVSDSGVYICQAIGYDKYTPGSELSVRLTVEPYSKIEPGRPIESCKVDEATCSNGNCIPKSSVCNGKFDCGDGSDEMACNVHGVCEPNEFKCANKRCILKTWLCDSEDDCKDGSDEAQCAPGRPGAACRPHEFQCQSGRQCVPRSFHCDGEKDCLDGSDEVGCSPVYISRPPPPMMILEEHSTFVVSCIAVGVPTPQVVWRLNWGHIPPKCSYTSEEGVGTLTCPDIRHEDQGAYSCEALNNRGSVFAVPDTILVINSTDKTDVCPAGYFNSEARVVQDCISCFCFGTSTECRSADLFTFQLLSPLDRMGSHLKGVIQQAREPLQIIDEPISDIFSFTPEDRGAMITLIGQWSPRNIYPYLALPETYYGSQLTSYGGYIKYTVRPQSNYPAPYGYKTLPDIIIKGRNILLTHSVPSGIRQNQDNNISVRLFAGQWMVVTPNGPKVASREDIMMVLANIEAILLRGEENGSGVEIRNFQMDSARNVNSGQGPAAFVEECKCPQGYSGLSCQKCSPGYKRVDSGRWLGRCVREEEPCQPGYYGNPSAGVSCRLCPCPFTNPANQFSHTCQLDSDGQVTCNNCPTGYLGRRCEVCAPGYVGNPTVPGDRCRPAPPPPPPSPKCDARGTVSQIGDHCNCKPNVVGSRCNECADEAFNLSYDNVFGCSRCFCMGVTRSCTSSKKRRSLISARFASQSSAQSVRVIEWEDKPDGIRSLPQSAVRFDSSQQEVSLTQLDSNEDITVYWSLPDWFIGEKITAYGGFLNYTVRYISNPGATKNNAPDIQLISKNDITLMHYNRASPSPDGILSESVQILEQNWERGDGKQVDREHILMALADLQSILIKATYTSSAQRSTILTASLQIADERGVGERASHVEECQCPDGYQGTSCQDCAPGYSRTLDGLYLGYCQLCNCNGHSTECHPETGDCMNCQHNTEGSACEECKSGYEGDATLGFPESCKPKTENDECRCDPRGTMSPYCQGDNICRCKINVQGERCDECVPGTFKLSSSNVQGCSSCYCSHVTDQCSEAYHLYRQQIPIGIIDNTHGFTLTSLDQSYVIGDNFQLNIPLNQISYDFGGRPPSERLFWSLPSAFTGNKVTSYGGQIMITQKFDSLQRSEYATDDMDVILVGRSDTIYWRNPRKLRAGATVAYSVPLNESGWMTMSTGEAPQQLGRIDMLSVLSDLRLVLVRATLSSTMTSTSIGDIAMDTAVPAESTEPVAEGIELCRCPTGYSGTSCESCATGHYRTLQNMCDRCPCSNREEACYLGANRNVICECRPGFIGEDCSIFDYGNDTEITTSSPTVQEPSLQVVIAAPNIENKPAGGTVQFICSARSSYSSSPIRVSWSKEGGMLPLGRTIEDASRGILTIRDLQASDSGTYICQANDGVSTSIDRASLIVPRNEFSPPYAKITPPFLEVSEGEPIEIQCQSTGNPTPTLTWTRVNRQPLNFQHTFVNGVFRIGSAKPSDQGEYSCIASNSMGQNMQVAVIYVNPRPEAPARPPVLSVNPAQPIVPEGESITLVCSADQSVPTNLLTWTRDDGFLPPNFRSQNGQLRIESIRPEDAGVYHCTAERYPMRVVPASVVLTIRRTTPPPQAPASVTLSSSRETLPEGQSITIKCEPRGSPLPIIKWTKQGASFGPGVSQRGNSLMINQARMSDRGIYMCTGSTVDDITIAQASILIDIERREIPGVMVWPEEVQLVQPGGAVKLQCHVLQGAPDPVLTWSRPSGRSLTANTHLQPGGVLNFASVTVNEEGVYTCTGSNEAGENSANATIKLHLPPVISIYPDTYLKVQAGKEVSVECRATGHPEPLVHWIMVSPVTRQFEPASLGSAILRIPSVEEADEGMYACVAQSDAGNQEENVRIDIMDNEIDSEPVRGDVSGPVPAKVSISASRNVTAKQGSSLQVNCKGSRQINQIVWTKADTRKYLSAETYAGGSILKLDNVTPKDSGIYRCEGYDYNGVPTVDEFSLYVYPETSIYVPEQPQRPPISSGDLEQRPEPIDDRDFQQDSPVVYTAKLGMNVIMPCQTNLPPPVSFQWERPYGQLPRTIQARSPTLSLTSVNESDAGPYVCRVSSGNLVMERKVILKISHVVPQFSGNGYLALDTLRDAYLHFDIEVSIKPQDYNGIILYNSRTFGVSGDMVSLSLVEGIPEFRYVLGSGLPVVIRGNQPLSLNQWHNIKISRSSKDGYMYVDGVGPFTGSATSKTQGLDLTQPLYVGGVPDYQNLPEDFHPKNGFTGCIGRLLLENVDVSLMREAKDIKNVDNCDSCSPNPCQNRAVCQEALTERGYSCLCLEGYSGVDCSRTGDSCRPGLCGPGRCSDTNDGFYCTCPIGYGGHRCESRIQIEYPAFGGRAYLAFSPPKTARHLKISLKVKPNYPIKDGLILYCAESRHGHGDFTSLALKDGHLEFRFDSGTGPAVIRSRKPLVANEWVDVVISRVLDKGKLSVQGQDAVTGGVPRSKKTSLTLFTPLYVGGYDSEWLTINKAAEVQNGFNGCISDVIVSDHKLDIINSPIKSANVRNCGDPEIDNTPYRGDIPMTTKPFIAESENVCDYCENGGYCNHRDEQQCICPQGYSGTYCETAQPTQGQGQSLCDRQPCENGGTCRPTRLGALYRCDCPKHFGGFQCRQRVELREDVSLAGEGYVELPASLLPHDNPKATEVIAIAFTTSSPDGLLVFQGENGTNFKDGDFIMLSINGGYVELQWDLGNGVGTIRNTRVQVSDNQRHQVVVKRTALDATLEVDNIEDTGRAPGLTQILNADSNIFVGGIPSDMTPTGIIGFSGCIHQIEFQDSRAIDFGRMSLATRNANPCSKFENMNNEEENGINY